MVELVVPVGRSITARPLAELKAVEDRIQRNPRHRPRRRRRSALARDGARPRRQAGCVARRPSATSSSPTSSSLIAASPQNELLPSFWNAETGESRLLVRMKEQQPAPDKTKIFRLATEAAAEQFGPASYLTGLSLIDDPNHEAIIATQWGTFLWSAIGILIMLTLAFRSVSLAVLAILPTLAFGRAGTGADGLAARSSSTWRPPWSRASPWGSRWTTRFTACFSSTAMPRPCGFAGACSTAIA